MEIILIAIVFSPIVLGTGLYIFNKVWAARLVFLSLLINLLLLILLTEHYINLGNTKIVLGGYSDVWGIGLTVNWFTVVLLWFSFLVFTIVILYSYQDRKFDYKFLFFLLVLLGCFNGLVISDDLYNIFILMDIITVISAILIIYQKDGDSLRAGIYYLLFNTVGMAFYLLGVILIYYKFGTLNISRLGELVTAGSATLSLKLAVVMLITSLGIKSAIFPVYDWLPRAHSSSPTEVSALLSGLLVKTGMIGIIKIMMPLSLFSIKEVLLILGLFSGVSGAIFAISHYDIKKILSYHTISQVGLIMIGYSYSTKVGTIFLVNHGLYKMMLFLSAGKYIKIYKTRDIRKMRNAFAGSPLVSIVFIISILSITGFPGFAGFLGKVLIKKEIGTSWYLWIFYIINFMTALSFIKILQIFKRHGNPEGHDLKDSSLDRFAFLLGGASLLVSSFSSSLNHALYEVEISKLYQVDKITNSIMIFLLGGLAAFLLVKNPLGFFKKLQRFAIPFPRAVILIVFFFSFLFFVI